MCVLTGAGQSQNKTALFAFLWGKWLEGEGEGWPWSYRQPGIVHLCLLGKGMGSWRSCLAQSQELGFERGECKLPLVDQGTLLVFQLGRFYCLLIIVLPFFYFSGAFISLRHVFSHTKAKQLHFSMG